MSTIMFGATVLLILSGVCFSGLYLWLNLFSSLPDIDERSRNALKISRVSVVLSIAFSFLNSIITDKAAEEAIALSSLLFTIVAVSLFVVALASAVAMIYSVASRYSYRRGLGFSIGKLFVTSAVGGSVALILGWLLG